MTWRQLAGPADRRNLLLTVYAAVLALGVGAPVAPPTYGALLAIPVAFTALRYLYRSGSNLIRSIPMIYLGMFLLAPLTVLFSLEFHPGRTFNQEQLSRDIALFGSIFLIMLGAVWAAKKIGIVPVLVLAGVGISINAFLNPDFDNLEDLLKFRIAPTLAFIILGLVARAAAPIQFAAGALVLAIGAFANLRATTAAALVAIAVIVARSMRARRSELASERTTLMPVLVTAAFALFAVLVAYPAAAASGLLGNAIRTRQLVQEDGAGAFGARIEIGASLGLLQDSAIGRGIGILPSDVDRLVAQQGFADVGVTFGGTSTPNSRLASMRLKSPEIYLHSNIMETWWAFGPIAFILFAAVAMVLVSAFLLIARATSMYMAGLMSYAITRSLWDIFFEPARPIGYNLFLTVGVCLYLLTRAQHTRFNPTAAKKAKIETALPGRLS